MISHAIFALFQWTHFIGANVYCILDDKIFLQYLQNSVYTYDRLASEEDVHLPYHNDDDQIYIEGALSQDASACIDTDQITTQTGIALNVIENYLLRVKSYDLYKYYTSVINSHIQNHSFDNRRMVTQSINRIYQKFDDTDKSSRKQTLLRVSKISQGAFRTKNEILPKNGLVIIGSPYCGFCRILIDDLRSINKEIESKDVTISWIADTPLSLSEDTVRDWFDVSGGQDLLFVASPKALEVFSFAQTPIIYHLENGVVTGKIVGWRPNERDEKIARLLDLISSQK